MSTTKNTKNTDNTEAAARAALGFVPAGKPTGEDKEASARALLSIQPAAPATEPEGKPELVNKATPAEPVKPEPEAPAVKAAQAEPVDGEDAGDGDSEAVETEAETEKLDGETFSKQAVTEIAARAYKRGAASRKVKTMEEELNSLKAELTTMKREKAVNSLASEYGLEPDLLSETKLEGAELEAYAQKLAEAQPKQEAFGFQSVRAAVNARAAKPIDAWSQLAAALR